MWLRDLPGVEMDSRNVRGKVCLRGGQDFQAGFNRAKLDYLAMCQRALGVAEVFPVDDRSVPRAKVVDDQVNAVVEDFAMPFGNGVVVDAERVVISPAHGGAMGRDFINSPRKFFSDKNKLRHGGDLLERESLEKFSGANVCKIRAPFGHLGAQPLEKHWFDFVDRAHADNLRDEAFVAKPPFHHTGRKGKLFGANHPDRCEGNFNSWNGCAPPIKSRPAQPPP
jgi:hypothetical protein